MQIKLLDKPIEPLASEETPESAIDISMEELKKRFLELQKRRHANSNRYKAKSYRQKNMKF